MKRSGFLVLAAMCVVPIFSYANGVALERVELFNFDRDSSESPSKLKIEQISAVDHMTNLPKVIIEKLGHIQGRLYLLTSPTQPTGGYQYSYTQNGNKVSFCLNKPKTGAKVTQVLSNPAAVAVVENESLLVSTKIQYCDM